ncbi:MAG: hypothetical protein ACOC1I_02490 [Spirochaetota bacterium]
MKRILLALVLVVFTLTGAWAQLGIRNISSVGVDADFDGSLALDINQVVLFDLVDWLSGEVSLQRQDSSTLRETTISVAPIFIVSDYNYIIVRYGLGIGAGNEGLDSSEAQGSADLSHDLTIDGNYETATMYANIAVRGSYYPADNYWFVLPTVAGRLQITERTGVLGRYFFSYNSEQAVSNAVIAELSYRFTDRLSGKAGATGSLDLHRAPGDPSTGAPPEWELTGIAGVSFQVRPGLALRYHLEYLGRLDGTDGIRNILVLDASF